MERLPYRRQPHSLERHRYNPISESDSLCKQCGKPAGLHIVFGGMDGDGYLYCEKAVREALDNNGLL